MKNLGFIPGTCISVVNSVQDGLIVNVKGQGLVLISLLPIKLLLGRQIMTLNEARVGKFYEVVEIKGSGSLKRRIMDMGITKKPSYT